MSAYLAWKAKRGAIVVVFVVALLAVFEKYDVQVRTLTRDLIRI